MRSHPEDLLLKASQMLSSTDGWTLAEVAAERLATASRVMLAKQRLQQLRGVHYNSSLGLQSYSKLRLRISMISKIWQEGI